MSIKRTITAGAFAIATATIATQTPIAQTPAPPAAGPQQNAPGPLPCVPLNQAAAPGNSSSSPSAGRLPSAGTKPAENTNTTPAAPDILRAPRAWFPALLNGARPEPPAGDTPRCRRRRACPRNHRRRAHRSRRLRCRQRLRTATAASYGMPVPPQPSTAPAPPTTNAPAPAASTPAPDSSGQEGRRRRALRVVQRSAGAIHQSKSTENAHGDTRPLIELARRREAMCPVQRTRSSSWLYDRGLLVGLEPCRHRAKGSRSRRDGDDAVARPPF